MATKKKAAKPAKKTVHVKKIAPAKKAAAKPAHSSGSSKSAKKLPAAKSIAKPAAKKVVPSSSAKRKPALPPKNHRIAYIQSRLFHMVKPSNRVRKGPARRETDFNPLRVQNAASCQAPAYTRNGHNRQTGTRSRRRQANCDPPPPPPPPVAVKPEPKKPTAPPKQVKVVIPEIKTKTVRKYEPEFTKSVLDTPQEEQTGPTMRYSDSELGEFRELINRKLDAAKKELAYLQGLITRKDEMGGDNDDARYMTMEDGSMSMEREQLSQMASRQITFIDHLEKALMRIENKTYGICRVTGKLIDKARLRAVPHATLSIEAKQMMNK
jgi:RNA polymerase-binding transcription factor DksA